MVKEDADCGQTAQPVERLPFLKFNGRPQRCQYKSDSEDSAKWKKNKKRRHERFTEDQTKLADIIPDKPLRYCHLMTGHLTSARPGGSFVVFDHLIASIDNSEKDISAHLINPSSY
ncbi:hypothetical protein [Acidocella sp.]|uniref:hypothetical protein n=1 Tax=Acidocella sp. TaxID=50710 RepID=UPI0026147FDE|nr:hypothetical protein [Acidocella sp.]